MFIFLNYCFILWFDFVLHDYGILEDAKKPGAGKNDLLYRSIIQGLTSSPLMWRFITTATINGTRKKCREGFKCISSLWRKEQYEQCPKKSMFGGVDRLVYQQNGN